MGIVDGIDERRVIQPDETSFTRFPLPAVTAIDIISVVPPGESPNGYGSGIVIAPNYVLTAAHVVYDYGSQSNAEKVRVTTSANATPDNLISRKIGDNNTDPDPNVDTDENNGGIFYPFPLFDNRKFDIALHHQITFCSLVMKQ